MGKDLFEDLGVDRRTTSKWFLKGIRCDAD
jgi:hypothetical protein